MNIKVKEEAFGLNVFVGSVVGIVCGLRENK